VQETRPKTLDELRELAAALDDLAAHPAWATVVSAAQVMFGERVTLERISGLCSAGVAPELIGTGTLELVTQHRTARQMAALPETLAKKYRESADRILQKDAAPGEASHFFGPDVEVTTGRR
jgi:hypothetical protein